MSIKKSQIENFLSINIYFEGFPPKFKKSYSGSILLTLLSVLTFSLPSTMVRADVSFVETILDAASSANLQQATDTVVSPDGKFVYVISWGSSSLSVFSRDSSSGLLTFVEELKDGVNGINGLNTLFGIDVSLDGNNIYTIAGGGSDQTISSFKRDSITGKLTLVAEYTEGGNDGKGNTVTGLSCALDLVVSPDGKNVYGLGTGSSSLVVFNRNGTTGELTYSTTFTDGVDGIDGLSTSCSPDAGPINSIAISPDGAYLYNAASGDNSITTWQRDVTTGALTYGNSLIDGIDGSDGLQGITSLIISPDGSTIYTSGQAENKLGVFNRSEVTGNVTFIEVQTDGSNGVNNIAGVRSLAISQDGKFVFASAITDNAITMFDRDNATGALTFNDDVTDSDPGVDGLGGVSGMVVSPENTHIYAAAQSDAAITVFSLPRPGITLSVSNAVFNKHDTALILDSALVLFDTNSINLSSGEVRISSGFITGDILAATDIGSITTSYDANTGVLTLSGIDTLENYQKVLRSVTFIHEGNNPTQDNTVVSRTIIFQIIDDTDLSSVPKVFSLVVNDATVPAAPVVTTPTNAEITSKNPYSISGTHSEDGVTVYLYADSNNDGVADNSTSLASSIVSSNAWSFSVTLTSDAANNFVIKAGNNVDNFSKDVALPTITHSSNNAPVISEGTSITVTMSEDNAPIPFALTLNATDANGGDTLTWSIKSPASTGSVAVSGVDTGSSQVIHYTTNTNFFGSDSFIVGVSDGTVSDTITVNVTIVSVNDIPTIVIGNTLSTDEDNNQTLNFTFDDVDGDTVSATVSTQATNGTASVSGTTVSYVPNENFFGTDSFTLTLMDNAGFTTTQVISVTVNSVNDEPTITIDSTLSTNEDNNQTLSFTFDDVDGDTVSASVINQASNGVASVTGTTVSYVPNDNFNGSDSFTLLLTDSAGFETIQTINVTVDAVNDMPIAVNDNYTMTVASDGTYTLNVLQNDIDIDNDPLTIEWVSSDLGTVSIVDNEVVLKTDTIGTINLSYGMSDGVDSSVGLVTLITEIAVSEWVDITAPADIEINASGLFTKVNIGSAIAVDSNGEALAVSLDRDSVYFAPGLHTIYWSSEDSKGHKAQVSQKVTVHPMINISKDAQTIEGAEHHIGVYLNGAAPSYPVTIAYTVSGSSDSEDHDLVDGFITIESGTEGVIELSTYKDENTEGQETLIVFLSNTLNLGSHASYELTIDEGNIAPDVHITVSQDNEERSTVQNNNDLVTVTANVVDANVEDTHSYHWINDNIDLTNVSNSDDVFEFSAQELTVGYYQLQLEVTDSSDAIVTTNVYIEVVEDLAVLDSQDSDGDLIPDDYEGYGDSDGDGIADYEDAISECNIIQEEALVSESYLVEGESSACLRKGVSVANNNSGGTLLRNYELSSDYNAKNIGGVFDFVIYDLPTAGQTYLLVVPQRLPIPSDAVYRKYKGDGVWGEFQENGKNYLSSARGAKGYCPPPGDSDWLVGLHEGDWCVQIAIEDGGVNDADGLVNSAIVDPGGVSSYSNNTLPEAVDDSASIITGNTINIDVLINDSDVDNDTLSITSASAQFGSVTIERELLRYTSLDDFIGTDVISYGISDGNGGSASAEVTVTVKADTSEVVRNSTGGSMGGLLILILGSFVLIRYQGRIITGGLLILISSNSQANWFIETELGISLADSEWSVDESYVQDSDRTDLAWAIGVGYYLTPDWALTARYLDLGQGSATLSTDNSMDPDKYHEVVAKNSPALVEGVAVEVDYSLLKNEKVNLQATLGLLSWGVDFNSEYQDTHISSSENGIDPYIGIGVDYKLSKKWIAGLAVNQYFIDLNNVTTFSLKLSYLFNSN